MATHRLNTQTQLCKWAAQAAGQDKAISIAGEREHDGDETTGDDQHSPSVDDVWRMLTQATPPLLEFFEPPTVRLCPPSTLAP